MSANATVDRPVGPAPRADLPRRPALIVLLVLGIALVIAPVAFQMFSRAPQGADMLADFKPFMTVDRLDGFQQEIATIDAGVREVDQVAAGRLGPLDRVSPDYAPLSERWPAIQQDMAGLLDEVQANRENYEAMAGLPSFRLFPWFFAVPGVLIAAGAAAALRRPRVLQPVRGLLVVVGIGLIVAPLAFGMFWRAPKGGEMMTAFRQIETADNVERIQGYVSTMAAGQGAIRLQIVPALRDSGWSDAEIARRLPAMTRLNDDWIAILNDLTPMIGAMSDSVPRYEAISSLPPFPLFPWAFVIPGVLTAGVAGLALRRSTSPTRPARPIRGES